MKRVGLHIEKMPRAVARAVARDAKAQGTNRNNVICEIIARELRVDFEPTTYKFKESTGEGIFLRMTEEMRNALRARADEMSEPGRRIAMNRLVVSMLQVHYDLSVDSPRRRSHHPPLDPKIVRAARARAEAGESIRSLSRRYGVKRETLAKAIKQAA